jgi:hypothetical protein
MAEECIREFYFLMDVIAGRAQGKGDLSSKSQTQ